MFIWKDDGVCVCGLSFCFYVCDDVDVEFMNSSQSNEMLWLIK